MFPILQKVFAKVFHLEDDNQGKLELVSKAPASKKSAKTTKSKK